MNKRIYSREEFIECLKELADKYSLQIADKYNATRLRDDLFEPIKSCEENNIDIHDMFPICIKCGNTIEFKFFQCGTVYLHTPYRVVYIHGPYTGDSICLDNYKEVKDV